MYFPLGGTQVVQAIILSSIDTTRAVLEFIVKLSKLGARTLINAIALEASLNNRQLLCTYLYQSRVIKLLPLDISTNDFASPSFYPHSLDTPDAPPLVHGLFLPIESLI